MGVYSFWNQAGQFPAVYQWDDRKAGEQSTALVHQRAQKARAHRGGMGMERRVTFNDSASDSRSIWAIGLSTMREMECSSLGHLAEQWGHFSYRIFGSAFPSLSFVPHAVWIHYAALAHTAGKITSMELEKVRETRVDCSMRWGSWRLWLVSWTYNGEKDTNNGGDEYVHSLDYGDGFMGVCIFPYLANYIH